MEEKLFEVWVVNDRLRLRPSAKEGMKVSDILFALETLKFMLMTERNSEV